MSKISVITPVYNERENLPKFIPRVESVLSDYGESFEIVIVDDKSPDGSGEVAEKLAQKFPNIKVLHRQKKMGLGLAYKDGFKITSGEIIVSIDSDLSHDPSQLPSLLKMAELYDVVVGSRFVQGGEIKGRAVWRDALSSISNWSINRLTGYPIVDWTSGLRVYNRTVLEKILPKVACIKWDFQFEVLYKSLLSGFKVKEIPISFVERAGGRSKFNLLEALYFTVSFFKIYLDNSLKRVFSKQ